MGEVVTMRRILRAFLATALVAMGLAAAIPAGAETVVTEVYHVPTVGDAVIRVEVTGTPASPGCRCS